MATRRITRRGRITVGLLVAALTAAATGCGDDGPGVSAGVPEEAEDIASLISIAQQQAEAADREAEEAARAAGEESSEDASYGDESGGADPVEPRGDTDPQVAVTDAEPDVETWDVGTTAWWDGFEITVESVESTGDDTYRSVILETTFANHTDHLRAIGSFDIRLRVGDQSYGMNFGVTPEVPAGGRNSAPLDFAVDGPFDAADAALVVGGPEQRQAVVPLDGSEPVSFRPEEVEVAGDLSTELTTITIEGAASIVPSYEIGEQDVFLVRVPVAMSYAGTSRGGQLVVTSHFTLEAPGGESYASGSVGQVGDLVAEPLYPDQAPTQVAIAFKVTGLAAGTYTVTYTDDEGGTGTATFEVPDDVADAAAVAPAG